MYRIGILRMPAKTMVATREASAGPPASLQPSANCILAGKGSNNSFCWNCVGDSRQHLWILAHWVGFGARRLESNSRTLLPANDFLVPVAEPSDRRCLFRQACHDRTGWNAGLRALAKQELRIYHVALVMPLGGPRGESGFRIEEGLSSHATTLPARTSLSRRLVSGPRPIAACRIT